MTASEAASAAAERADATAAGVGRQRADGAEIGGARRDVAGLLTVVLLKPAEPMIQVAVLDASGGTRGTDTNELALLNQEWKSAPAQRFVKVEELQAWEKDWPARKAVVKVVYDRSAGEVRVAGRSNGRRFAKAFPVEKDLAAALRLAGVFIREQARLR